MISLEGFMWLASVDYCAWSSFSRSLDNHKKVTILDLHETWENTNIYEFIEESHRGFDSTAYALNGGET